MKYSGLLIMLAALSSAFLQSGYAETYHVDSAIGNDDNNGSTPQTPWSSLGRVMRASLKPGDKVLFARGSVWRGQFRPAISGLQDNPVVYGAYGNGALPSIRGTRLLSDPRDWNKDINGVWYTNTVEHDPWVLVHDGIPGKRVSMKSELTEPWTFWYDSPRKRVYVCLDDNPAKKSPEVEIAAYEFVIGPQDSNHIVFEDLDLRASYSSTWCGWGAMNITFRRCNFALSSENHLQFNNGCRTGTVTDCTFDSWNLRNLRNYAIQAIDKGSGPIDITGCTFRASAKGGGPDHTAIMNDEDSWIRTVRDCHFEGVQGNLTADGVVIWHPTKDAKDITIEDNEFTELGGVPIILQEVNEHAAQPVIRVRRNLIRASCLSDTLDKEAVRIRDISSNSDVEIDHNLILETRGGKHEHHGFAVESASGIKIFNNTVIGCDDAIILRRVSKDVDIRNNIFSNNRGAGIRIGTACTVSRQGHNCVSGNAGGDYVGAAPVDTDINKDPKLDKDGRLSPASPCIDAGEDLGPGYDLDGRKVPTGKGTDIGAQELQTDSNSTGPK
jgi:hypothetical protein